MKKSYDFSNAIRNPFAEKIKKEGYTIRIHHENGNIEIEKITPEKIENERIKNRKKYLAKIRRAIN